MRAQGWAEAEKAKAQRNPAAMREHEQIFGQAPRIYPGSPSRRAIDGRVRRSGDRRVLLDLAGLLLTL